MVQQMNDIFSDNTHTLFLWCNVIKPKSTVELGGGGRRGVDRMVVGFTTTSAISAYHH